MATPRFRTLLLAVLLGPVGWTGGLFAQTVFTDDFESGSLCIWSSAVGGECTCFDVGLGASRPTVSPAPGQILISEWMPNPMVAPDASGEWFEVVALVPIDLNGLQAGTTSLNAAPVIPAGGNCIHLEAGDFGLLARSSADNGGLPAVDGIFPFGLVSASGTLQIGLSDLPLHTRTWASSTEARSIMIDSDGSQCTAPAGVTAYNGTDVGTPKTSNTPPECPP